MSRSAPQISHHAKLASEAMSDEPLGAAHLSSRVRRLDRRQGISGKPYVTQIANALISTKPTAMAIATTARQS
jgi:hypothetical protein